MKKICFCGVFVVLLTVAGLANAVVIDQGAWNVNLPANTADNVILLEVTSGDLVSSMLFQSYIADGGPEAGGVIDGPEFTGFDFTGSIWEDAPGGYTTFTAGLDPGTFPQAMAYNAYLPTLGENVAANGLLIAVTVDTTGFSSGVFDFNLYGSLTGEPFNTEFIGSALNLSNGSITLVPEPATLSMLAIGGLAFLRNRKRA